MTSNTEESGHLHDASPEEAATQDPAEQEEELEDEEDSEEIEGQSPFFFFLCVYIILNK